ncbi:protein phosphatase 2C family protein [Striga asiatica]|uniref:Protein phosphatase 2C family protein n=1 Tax=Striga asiatica TaxID=4170 RepID=A0A5A7PJJ9_STRAF|nr:protein phosphatase 2C family protein [Striga asiatica]
MTVEYSQIAAKNLNCTMKAKNVQETTHPNCSLFFFLRISSSSKNLYLIYTRAIGEKGGFSTNDVKTSSFLLLALKFSSSDIESIKFLISSSANTLSESLFSIRLFVSCSIAVDVFAACKIATHMENACREDSCA